MKLFLEPLPDKNEKKVRLFLKEDKNDGSIDLKAEDEDGDEWVLLAFKSDGRVIAYRGLSSSLGFKLVSDEKDYLKVVPE